MLDWRYGLQVALEADGFAHNFDDVDFIEGEDHGRMLFIHGQQLDAVFDMIDALEGDAVIQDDGGNFTIIHIILFADEDDISIHQACAGHAVAMDFQGEIALEGIITEDEFELFLHEARFACGGFTAQRNGMLGRRKDILSIAQEMQMQRMFISGIEKIRRTIQRGGKLLQGFAPGIGGLAVEQFIERSFGHAGAERELFRGETVFGFEFQEDIFQIHDFNPFHYADENSIVFFFEFGKGKITVFGKYTEKSGLTITEIGSILAT